MSIKDKYNLMPTPRPFIMYFYSMKQVSKMERKPILVAAKAKGDISSVPVANNVVEDAFRWRKNGFQN